MVTSKLGAHIEHKIGARFSHWSCPPFQQGFTPKCRRCLLSESESLLRSIVPRGLQTCPWGLTVTDLTQGSLLCPIPLADARKQPVAMLWQTCWHDPQAFAAWLATDDFSALVQRQPQVWSATTVDAAPPECRSLITAAGGIIADSAQIITGDPNFPVILPSGGQWVQGNWYCQPPKNATAAQESSRALVLRLVQLVAADAETRDIENIFRQDANLSYQLLRLVNSPAFAPKRPITSFTQAILLLGRQQLRRWLNLILFAARDDDPRSPMLMARVTLRARGLELLAQETGLDRLDQDQAFMVGMFSLLPILFGRPPAEILEPLNLSADLNDALRHGKGRFGQLLQTWEASENSDQAALAQALQQMSLSARQFNQVAVSASRWAVDLTVSAAGH